MRKPILSVSSILLFFIVIFMLFSLHLIICLFTSSIVKNVVSTANNIWIVLDLDPMTQGKWTQASILLKLLCFTDPLRVITPKITFCFFYSTMRAMTYSMTSSTNNLSSLYFVFLGSLNCNNNFL